MIQSFTILKLCEMLTKKDKNPVGSPGLNHPKSHVSQSILASHSNPDRKGDNMPHSYYYLFEDDDYATLGRNLSEYTETRTDNTNNPSKGKKS